MFLVSRRNQITRDDERVIRALAVISSVIAVFSGARPTGGIVADVLLVAVFAGFVTWTGASATWWALVAASGLGLAGALGGSLLVVALSLLALVASGLLGWERLNQPIARAAIAGVVVQVLLRLDWDPFFLASALLATTAAGLIVVTGVMRRRSSTRRRLYWVLGGVAAVGVLAVGMLGLSALGARESARDGYLAMLDGLEFVQQGETVAAAETLREAAANLDEASGSFGGALTQPARLVPGVAQNRNAAAEVLSRAARSAEAAADTLDVVDLSQLTVQDGVVNVTAFAALEAPLSDLEQTIVELDDALRDAESPWLIPAFAERLDEALERARQVVPQAKATAAAARMAPSMLGVDGERRYFVAFVNNAEARGVGGVMGNWNEVTITNGRLEVTATGRTAELQSDALMTLQLAAREDYLERYDDYGARDGLSKGVNPKFWSNVTFPPDMPSVGNAMSQMYQFVTGRRVDGVIVIDPSGVAQLLAVTGPVELDTVDRRIDSSNAERFLQLEQYDYAENEREDLLAEVTDKTIDRVLEGSLPPPQRLAPILADAVLNGHISAWVERDEEQQFIRMVGMDDSLPEITEAGVDAFAVTNINGSGNKIETFLEREVTYHAVVDEGTGDVDAMLRVEFTNTAPTSGYPDYVIGNLVGGAEHPVGSNRMLVHVHTILPVMGAKIDGAAFTTTTQQELGYHVWSTVVTVPAGDTAVLELALAGNVGAGGYRLVYRPQALPQRDQLDLEATTKWGRTLIDFEGTLERRTVLSRERIEAWRSPK